VTERDSWPAGRSPTYVRRTDGRSGEAAQLVAQWRPEPRAEGLPYLRDLLAVEGWTGLPAPERLHPTVQGK